MSSRDSSTGISGDNNKVDNELYTISLFLIVFVICIITAFTITYCHNKETRRIHTVATMRNDV